jgi:hypothetical protein
MKYSETKLREKLELIQHEVDAGFKAKALDRLENMLRYDPENLELWNAIAQVYYDSGFKAKAGKYWLFYPSNDYKVVKCAELYRESMNSNAQRILRDLNFRGNMQLLPRFSREILEAMELEAYGEIQQAQVQFEKIEVNQTFAQKLLAKLFMILACSAILIGPYSVGIYYLIKWLKS